MRIKRVGLRRSIVLNVRSKQERLGQQVVTQSETQILKSAMVFAVIQWKGFIRHFVRAKSIEVGCACFGIYWNTFGKVVLRLHVRHVYSNRKPVGQAVHKIEVNGLCAHASSIGDFLAKNVLIVFSMTERMTICKIVLIGHGKGS